MKQLNQMAAQLFKLNTAIVTYKLETTGSFKAAAI